MAAAAAKIALVRDRFETRLMAESLSMRGYLSLIVTVEVRRGRTGARNVHREKCAEAETFQALSSGSQGPRFDRGPAFRSRELRLRLLEGEETFLHRTAQWESVRGHSGCWVNVALTS